MLCKALLYFNYGIKQRISVAEQLNFNAFVIVITVAPMLLSGIQAKKTGYLSVSDHLCRACPSGIVCGFPRTPGDFRIQSGTCVDSCSDPSCQNHQSVAPRTHFASVITLKPTCQQCAVLSVCIPAVKPGANFSSTDSCEQHYHCCGGGVGPSFLSECRTFPNQQRRCCRREGTSCRRSSDCCDGICVFSNTRASYPSCHSKHHLLINAPTPEKRINDSASGEQHPKTNVLTANPLSATERPPEFPYNNRSASNLAVHAAGYENQTFKEAVHNITSSSYPPLTVNIYTSDIGSTPPTKKPIAADTAESTATAPYIAALQSTPSKQQNPWAHSEKPGQDLQLNLTVVQQPDTYNDSTLALSSNNEKGSIAFPVLKSPPNQRAAASVLTNFTGDKQKFPRLKTIATQYNGTGQRNRTSPLIREKTQNRVSLSNKKNKTLNMSAKTTEEIQKRVSELFSLATALNGIQQLIH